MGTTSTTLTFTEDKNVNEFVCNGTKGDTITVKDHDASASALVIDTIAIFEKAAEVAKEAAEETAEETVLESETPKSTP